MSRETAARLGIALLIGIGASAQIAMGIIPAIGNAVWVLQIGWLLFVGAIGSVVVALRAEDKIVFLWFRTTAVAATGVTLAFLAGFASLIPTNSICITCDPKAQFDMFMVGGAACVACTNSVIALWSARGSRVAEFDQ